MREREGREGGAQQGTCHRSAQIQRGSFGSGDEYTARVKAFTVFFWVFSRSDGDLTNESFTLFLPELAFAARKIISTIRIDFRCEKIM